MSSPDRPTSDGVAFPFKLGRHLGDEGVNASTITLESQAGTVGLEANPEGLSGDEVGAVQYTIEKGVRDNQPTVDGPADGEQREASAVERPVVERFVTATAVERPGVERFVTARE